MDPFTENLLARARERKKLLEDIPVDNARNKSGVEHKIVSTSEPNLCESRKATNNASTFASQHKTGSCEGNFANVMRVSSPQSSKHSLNIKNDNFNMEIKVTSADNVRVEVQIEEQNSPESGDHSNESGLRADVKNRLNRLGKLYAGGDDANISSPIHKTESEFLIEDSQETPLKSRDKKVKKGLSKLVDLAQTINQWEDDTTHKTPAIDNKKHCKSLAPQPPNLTKPTIVKSITKSKAPSPPKAVGDECSSGGKVAPKKLNWDKKVLDSLESQGFTRTTSTSRLVYKYNLQEKESKMEGAVKCPHPADKENVIMEENKPQETKSNVKSPIKINQRSAAIANRAALFESSPSKPATKDPALLSVSERKALFEKNKGTALIPKAPFAMATPVKPTITPKGKPVKSPAPKPPTIISKPETKPRSIEEPRREAPRPEAKAKDVAEGQANVHRIGQGAGIAQTMASLFEGKTTISQEQIENNVRKQRQEEMELLLNRFKKPKEGKIEDDIDEEDEEEDLESVTEKTAMIGPKTPKVAFVSPSSSTQNANERKRNSGNSRCSTADSPKVAAVLNDVKRIKVSPQKAGRLYPSLTDIESATETEYEVEETRSPTPNYSSFDDSIAESDDVNTSFGRDILQTVCKNQTPLKRSVIDENTSSDMSDLLDGCDDYISEALAFDDVQNNGPTPPKQGRKSPIVPQPSNSFNYKSYSEFKSPAKTTITPRKSDDFPTYVVDGDNVLPLKHSVSIYRKQQTQPLTPVRHISHQQIIEEESDNVSNEQEEIKAKIRELQNEVNKQTMTISQTSQALNLCNSTPEFMGSTEQVEAERVLLIATHRRQAALHELQRLEVEGSLRPQGSHSKDIPLEKGTLTISNIVLPLKQKYVTALAAAGGKGHHVLCLIKCGEQIVSTQLVSTVVLNAKNPDLDLNIPGVYKLKNIYSDFTITFEVYCLQAQEEVLPHDIKYHINKKASSKLTPKKSKQENRLLRPIKESPGGPQAVRSPTFAMMGYIVFAVQAINKKHWTLNNTPSMSPLAGTVDMRISCELAVSVEHRGFLTMFEDVSGFGAWHRRWCLLKGNTISYWKYPEDERKVPPIDSISLKNCITKEVGPVSREICARMHTFLLERERTAYPQDRDTLVMIRKGDKTVIRHLLSTDTKEERIEWCKKLNAALTAQQMWGNK